MNWLETVRWDDKGLVPVIAQEAASGDVLMFAWMNREALQKTAELARRCISAVRAAACGTRAKSPAISRPCMKSGSTVTMTWYFSRSRSWAMSPINPE